MAFEVLYPDEHPSVKRHSSIDQFKGFFSVWKKGGWAPIVFDQLDGIDCEDIKTHPIILSWGDDIGYIFPEAHCSYASDHFIYTDKEGVEKKVLPECFGGGGDWYQEYVRKNTFINFDSDDSIGVHNRKKLRTGLDFCLADHNLPPVE